MTGVPDLVSDILILNVNTSIISGPTIKTEDLKKSATQILTSHAQAVGAKILSITLKDRSNSTSTAQTHEKLGTAYALDPVTFGKNLSVTAAEAKNLIY